MPLQRVVDRDTLPLRRFVHTSSERTVGEGARKSVHSSRSDRLHLRCCSSSAATAFHQRFGNARIAPEGGARSTPTETTAADEEEEDRLRRLLRLQGAAVGGSRCWLCQTTFSHATSSLAPPRYCSARCVDRRSGDDRERTGAGGRVMSRYGPTTRWRIPRPFGPSTVCGGLIVVERSPVRLLRRSLRVRPLTRPHTRALEPRCSRT